MKKSLSLILALLMLASSMTACGGGETKETENSTSTGVVETQAVETNAPATELPETDSPAPSYDTSLITENGVAKAHIVLAANATDKEKTAADELAYHIKLISGGAEIAVTNDVQEGSLPIIIGTPATVPELEELFPEDVAWLRTTYEEYDNEVGFRRFGEDGFAIRQHDGKLYIFGANADGALNGVYDFIEDNMDVIWVTSTEAGIIYDEMPTIEIAKGNYKEKSPFLYRYSGYSSAMLYVRNKHNTDKPAGGGHNMHYLITSSPIYDPTITEYWDTDIDGNHVTASESKQLNFWSDLTADTIAAAVIADLDKYAPENLPDYYSVTQMDIYEPSVYPEMREPFEYAPGQFVEPSDPAFLSTVLFTFINRVARQVGEKYPTVQINTFAYTWSQSPPLCDIDENVSIWFCPYFEDFTQESFAVARAEHELGEETSLASLEATYYAEWVEKYPEIMHFNYYFCHYVRGWYERPIWDRVQNDFRYFANTGCFGWFADGTTNDVTDWYLTWTKAGRTPGMTETQTSKDASAMNLLSYWLFFKLAWNPDEDVDALIERFCDKVYKDAAPYMKEYYRLLEWGWHYGSTEILPYTFNSKITLTCGADYYFNNFLDIDMEDGTYLLDAMRDALNKAWDAADDKTKEFIRQPYEVYQDWSLCLDK